VRRFFVDAKRAHRKNSILKHYVDICNLVDGDVSAEVNALTMTE
jgi:hypothetical protein